MMACGSFPAFTGRDGSERLAMLPIWAESPQSESASYNEWRQRVTEVRDATIAGIVLSRRPSLATRHVKPFDRMRMDLIDPWLPDRKD